MNSVAATSVHVGPGEIVYRSITALGWLLVNVGCVFGIYGGFFLLLGQASVSGFMVNLNNLAARYVAADAMRQASFDQLVLGVSFGLLILVCLLRRHSFPVNSWKGHKHV